jgi:hypothetical protein
MLSEMVLQIEQAMRWSLRWTNVIEELCRDLKSGVTHGHSRDQLASNLNSKLRLVDVNFTRVAKVTEVNV